MDDCVSSKIILVTGKQNTGKSTLCRKIISEFKKSNVKISGILSELEKFGDTRLAINSIDILTNEKKQLAIFSPGWDIRKPERKWKFQDDIFTWGNAILGKSVPTDLLIIDELGYMEFEEGRGWAQSFLILKGDQFKCAIVVIRPEFLELAKNKLQTNNNFSIENVKQGDAVKKNLIPIIRNFLSF